MTKYEVNFNKSDEPKSLPLIASIISDKEQVYEDKETITVEYSVLDKTDCVFVEECLNSDMAINGWTKDGLMI